MYLGEIFFLVGFQFVTRVWEMVYGQHFCLNKGLAGMTVATFPEVLPEFLD